MGTSGCICFQDFPLAAFALLASLGRITAAGGSVMPMLGVPRGRVAPKTWPSIATSTALGPMVVAAPSDGTLVGLVESCDCSSRCCRCCRCCCCCCCCEFVVSCRIRPCPLLAISVASAPPNDTKNRKQHLMATFCTELRGNLPPTLEAP